MNQRATIKHTNPDDKGEKVTYLPEADLQIEDIARRRRRRRED